MTATPVLHLMGCTQTHHVFAYPFTFVASSRSGLWQVVKVVVDENFRGGANEGKSSRLLHPLHICIFLIKLSFPFRLNAIFAASAHRWPVDEVVVDNRAVGPEHLSFIWASILKVHLSAPPRWPGDGLLEMVPFTAFAAPRLWSSHWPGGGLLGIMAIAFPAAATALILVECRAGGGGALRRGRRAAVPVLSLAG